MSRPVFGFESAAEVAAGSTVTLRGPEGHHASVVRRVRPGEPLVLTDGRGAALDVEVVGATRGEVACRVTAARHEPRPTPAVTVVQALPKGDRGELAVELLTEVGVDVIVPWQASRCVSRWPGDKAERGRAKWQAAAREAAKQSRRTWWPSVGELADTETVEQLLAASGTAWVLHEQAPSTLVGELDRWQGLGTVTLVVGPEGGLTDDEHARLTAAGASGVRLGPSVLRTSTAGVVGASLVLARTASWRA